MTSPRQTTPSTQRHSVPISIAERCFRKAINAIQSTARSGNHRVQRSPALLDVLFQAPSLPEMREFPDVSFTEDYLRELAAYQIGQVHNMLATQLGMSAGFAEAGVMVLDIFYKSRRYTRALLHAIASEIARDRDSDGEGLFFDLARNRFFGVTTNGLAGIDIEKAELHAMFRQQLDWHRENRLLFGQRVDERRRRSEIYERNAPVAVVLGCLPLVDEFDLAAATCRQSIIAGGSAFDAPDNDTICGISGAIVEPAMQYIPSSKNFLLSVEEYWRYYSKYLAMLPESKPRGGLAPVGPGEYRTLLAERQAIRDARLRLLAPYTGRRRKTATKYEVLATHYPLFFRLAEEFIRQAGAGVASLTSPSSYIASDEAKTMRKHLCTTFNSIAITDNSVCNEAETADGEPMASTRLDFSVCTMVKRGPACVTPISAEVWYLTNPFGTEFNLASMMSTPPKIDDPHVHTTIQPSERNGYSFRPTAMSEGYRSWPSIIEIYSLAINGLMEKRGGALHDTDKQALADRMRAYFDQSISWNDYAAMGCGMVKKQSRFNPRATREEARRKERYDAGRIRPYVVKPFDVRWCYYTAVRPVWHEARPDLAELQRRGNPFLVVRSTRAVEDEGVPFYFTDCLGDSDLLREHAYFIPTCYALNGYNRAANLTDAMMAYLYALGVAPAMSPESSALMVHHHVLAMAFAPAYLHENRADLGSGWPRTPFPGFDASNPESIAEARAALQCSAELGGQIAALLRGDASAFAFDDCAYDRVSDHFAVLNGPDASYAEEQDAPLYTVNQQWGKPFRDGAVLPSHGRLSIRGYTGDERQALEATAQNMGAHTGAAYALLGATTRDIFLNERVRLVNVPAKVWEFTVGGYQVMKKWLSYRETAILGRPLKFEEVAELCGMARRIVRIKLLGYHLNRIYANVRALHDKAPFCFRQY